MTRSVPSLAALFASVIALTSSMPAHARNDLMLRPIGDALNDAHAIEVVGNLPLRFGAASVGQADVLSQLVVEGVGSVIGDDPRKKRFGNPSTEEICLQAFEDALDKLAKGARQAGAGAALGIVSDYQGKLRDDAQAYECHVGSVKAFVTLRAELARSLPASRRLPPATGFAPLEDVGAVPLGDAGRERYAHFLTLPKPRAFVVYEDGGWRFYSKSPDAMTSALDDCAREGRRCWLYAADDRVVWSADVDKRIGASSQLEGEPRRAVAPADEHQ